MTKPDPDSTAPDTAQGDIDIDLGSALDADPDSGAATPTPGAADAPALTTSQDAQRDDLPVRPDNS